MKNPTYVHDKKKKHTNPLDLSSNYQNKGQKTKNPKIMKRVENSYST